MTAINYEVGWSMKDNPKSDRYGEIVPPIWFRVYRVEYNFNKTKPKMEVLTPPLTREQAFERLEQVKLLIYGS